MKSVRHICVAVPVVCSVAAVVPKFGGLCRAGLILKSFHPIHPPTAHPSSRHTQPMPNRAVTIVTFI